MLGWRAKEASQHHAEAFLFCCEHLQSRTVVGAMASWTHNEALVLEKSREHWRWDKAKRRKQVSGRGRKFSDLPETSKYSKTFLNVHFLKGIFYENLHKG